VTLTMEANQATEARLAGALEGEDLRVLWAAINPAVESGGLLTLDLSRVESLSMEAVSALEAGAAALARTGRRLMILVATEPAPRAVSFERFRRLLAASQERNSVDAGRAPVGGVCLPLASHRQT